MPRKEPLYPHAPKRGEALFPHVPKGRQPTTKLPAQLIKLYQRGPDGYPIGSDKIMRDAYGPIPNPDQPFWSGEGFIKPAKIYGWQWSPDYHSWRAYVKFPDGTETWTSPMGQRLPQASVEKPQTTKKPTRDDVTVESWMERDRLGIWITDKRTDKTIAEWWDDNARQMFEDGFFKPGVTQRTTEKPGREFVESVLDYAESMGLLAGGKFLASTINLLAKTEGNPIRKFCCRQCDECALKELLEEGRFPDRIAWLRDHYKAKHPGMWGKMQPAVLPQTIEGGGPIPRQYRHLTGWVSEPLPKEAE